MSRAHGCKFPFHALQISSWILFSVLVLSFYVLFTPIFPVPILIFLDLLYGVEMIVLVSSAAVATCTDMTVKSVGVDRVGSVTCVFCVRRVPENCKHCRKCQRCVQNFDHHCKWLNNCVGASNYESFFVAVMSAVMLLLTQFGVGVAALVLLGVNPDNTLQRIELFYNQTNVLWGVFFGLILAITVLVAIMAGSLLHLLGFHIMLIALKMTTYDYLMNQRRIAQEKTILTRGVAVTLTGVHASSAMHSVPQLINSDTEMTTLNVDPKSFDQVNFPPNMERISNSSAELYLDGKNLAKPTIDFGISPVSNVEIETLPDVSAQEIKIEIPAENDARKEVLKDLSTTISIETDSKASSAPTFKPAHLQVKMIDPLLIAQKSASNDNIIKSQSLSRHGSKQAFRLKSENVPGLIGKPFSSLRSFNISPVDLKKLQSIAENEKGKGDANVLERIHTASSHVNMHSSPAALNRNSSESILCDIDGDDSDLDNEEVIPIKSAKDIEIKK